jgi:hypothetical protein
MATYRRQDQRQSWNREWIKLVFMNNPFILFVAEPHDIDYLLYKLRLVHPLAFRYISIHDLNNHSDDTIVNIIKDLRNLINKAFPVLQNFGTLTIFRNDLTVQPTLKPKKPLN